MESLKNRLATVEHDLGLKTAKSARLAKELAIKCAELEEAHRCLGNFRDERTVLQGNLSLVTENLDRVKKDCAHFQMIVRAVRLCTQGTVMRGTHGSYHVS